MCKSLVTITASLAIMSLGSLISDHAQAGSSVSAPSKYSQATHTADLYQTRNNRSVRTARFTITEYSSSSAKSSVPHR
jgi:hypothetical protein